MSAELLNRLHRIERAVRTINELHNLGDQVYDVRERHGADPVNDKPFNGNSWEHPKVVAYGNAVVSLQVELPGAFK